MRSQGGRIAAKEEGSGISAMRVSHVHLNPGGVVVTLGEGGGRFPAFPSVSRNFRLDPLAAWECGGGAIRKCPGLSRESQRTAGDPRIGSPASGETIYGGSAFAGARSTLPGRGVSSSRGACGGGWPFEEDLGDCGSPCDATADAQSSD